MLFKLPKILYNDGKHQNKFNLNLIILKEKSEVIRQN